MFYKNWTREADGTPGQCHRDPSIPMRNTVLFSQAVEAWVSQFGNKAIIIRHWPDVKFSRAS